MFYLINEGLSECGLYSQDDLYWEVVFNTGLTIYIKILTAANVPGYEGVSIRTLSPGDTIASNDCNVYKTCVNFLLKTTGMKQ